jgi:hypothetical protein
MIDWVEMLQHWIAATYLNYAFGFGGGNSCAWTTL